MKIHKGVFALLVVLVFLACASAQELPPPSKKSPMPKKAVRLESLTWDPVNSKLSWVVTEGTVDESERYTPEGPRSFYSIDMRRAVMFFEGDGRRFSKQEALGVSALLNRLSRYTLESVLWWQEGEGEPIDTKLRADERLLNLPPPPAPQPHK